MRGFQTLVKLRPLYFLLISILTVFVFSPPSFAYNSIEYFPEGVIVRYKTGEDIVTTAFSALDGFKGNPQGKVFIIQKAWIRYGEATKLPTLVAYLDHLGFRASVETIETPHNDKIQSKLTSMGAHFFERSNIEPDGVCRQMALSMCKHTSAIYRNEVELTADKEYDFKFHLDKSTNACHVLLQTTNSAVEYTVLDGDGEKVTPISESKTAFNRYLTLPDDVSGQWAIKVKGHGEHSVTVVGNSPRGLDWISNDKTEDGRLTDVKVNIRGGDTNIYVVGEFKCMTTPGVFHKKPFKHLDVALCGTQLPLIDGIFAVKTKLFSVEGTERILLGEHRRSVLSGDLPPLFINEAPRGRTSSKSPRISTNILGTIPEESKIVALIDDEEVAFEVNERDSLNRIGRYSLAVKPPIFSEGDHTVEVKIQDKAGERTASTYWEFTVDVSTSKSLLINEVFNYGKKGQSSWVELYAIKNVDLSEYKITDLDGKAQSLSESPLPLSAGRYAVIKFANKASSKPISTARNINGVVQISLQGRKMLSRGNEQIIILRGDAIIDAVAISDNSGSLTDNEQEDLNELMSRDEWDRNSMARRGKTGESIGRKSVQDSNRASDFGIMPIPTPGKPNSNVMSSSNSKVAPKDGVIIINEVAPTALNPWAELYVVDGPVNLMEYTLTDMDALDGRISNRQATVKTGEYVIVHWVSTDKGKSEIDGVGDLNKNGKRDFYIIDKKPNITDDQLALVWDDTVIIDAVAWTNGDGKFSNVEFVDVFRLVSSKSWNIAFDGTEKGFVQLGAANNSIGRFPNLKDDNSRGNWRKLTRPTPSASNVEVTRPKDGSILIVEVQPNARDDYAVLYCVEGPIDISGMILSDLDGNDQQLATSPVNMKTGEKIIVIWGVGVDEIDADSDANGNGTRELYLSDNSLTPTDDQLVLMFDGHIYDAVVWTNGDGQISKTEMKDNVFLINKGHWQGTYDNQTNQSSSVVLEFNNSPLRRNSLETDINSKSDWTLKK